jgi:hypothetical protein
MPNPKLNHFHLGDVETRWLFKFSAPFSLILLHREAFKFNSGVFINKVPWFKVLWKSLELDSFSL